MRRKTIWYIHEYNQLPGSNWRKSRSTIICEMLAQKYNVIWWTASFDHHSKTQREVGKITISENFIIEVIKTSGYSKNISIRRFIRDNQFAQRMAISIKKLSQPDLIITDGNPIRFCEPENKYVAQYKIPVIVDMNDIWPDIIEMMSPSILKPLIHCALLPMYKKRNNFYKKSRAFISTGSHHLAELQRMPGDGKDRISACVYNGIDVQSFHNLLKGKLSDNIAIPDKNDKEVWCIFSGTLGANYDIDLIIQAAFYFEKNNKLVHFFVTGNGPQKEKIEKASKELNNLDYLGIVSYEDLIALYGKCDIGLAPYKASNSIDMPDKLFDYFAAGLAVICSLDRDAGEYIVKHKTGLKYKAGDSIDFTRCIQKMIEHRELLNEMKSNSNQLGPIFDINSQMQKLSNIVEQVIG